MCGVVGYVGFRDAASVLLAALRKLEYRGYDSAGIAMIGPDGRLAVGKTVGRIEDLAARLEQNPLPGRIGIGHTRWATHGPVTSENAHPHVGGNDAVALVHNGVIENAFAIRECLLARGYPFRSQTDSEVIAHLLADCLKHSPVGIAAERPKDDHRRYLPAIRAALAQLRGGYALAFLIPEAPGMLFAARRGSPLVIGVGKDEHFVASDTSALLSSAKRFVDFEDEQVAVLTDKTLRITDLRRGEVSLRSRVPTQTETTTGLDGHAHFMLKEIFEQPAGLKTTIQGRLDEEAASARFAGLAFASSDLRRVKRIVMTACGTSWHAALIGKYVVEELAKVPVEVDYASELRYRHSPLKRDTLVVALSQSGETADTLAALRELKRRGHPTLAICNAVDSTIAREADDVIYLHAGREIGVASTKTFTAQSAVLVMLALQLGRLRSLGQARAGRSSLNCEGCPHWFAKHSPATARSSRSRGVLPLSPTCSTWAASRTFPWPSKVLSSSRKSATSTPRAIRPPR